MFDWDLCVNADNYLVDLDDYVAQNFIVPCIGLWLDRDHRLGHTHC